MASQPPSSTYVPNRCLAAPTALLLERVGRRSSYLGTKATSFARGLRRCAFGELCEYGNLRD